MKKLAAVLALALLAAPAFAGSGAFKLSLWDRIAVAVPNNIDDVKGLELGIGSQADTFKGVQLDFIFARTSGEMVGWSSALITMHNDMTGLQGGLLTEANTMTGVQWGGINLVKDHVSGVQFGLYNQADSVKGVQLGFVNYTHNIEGLQLGLVNIADNGWFPAMILVNGRF